jgi:hypothetical protein
MQQRTSHLQIPSSEWRAGVLLYIDHHLRRTIGYYVHVVPMLEEERRRREEVECAG